MCRSAILYDYWLEIPTRCNFLSIYPTYTEFASGLLLPCQHVGLSGSQTQTGYIHVTTGLRNIPEVSRLTQEATLFEIYSEHAMSSDLSWTFTTDMSMT
jgi:hypothetical protein